jgi:hypothetical protein
MTIKTSPVVSLNASQLTICSGVPITFSAAGADLYNFFLNDASVQFGAANNYLSAAIKNGDKVSVIGINNTNGCSDTSSVISLNVNPTPLVNLNSSGDTICEGNSTLYSASGADNYVFKINGSVVQSGILSTYSTSGTSNGDKILAIGTFLSSGCIDSSALHTIIVNPLPIVNMSASQNSVCGKTPVSFTASGADDYSFFLNGINVQSGSSQMYTSAALANNDNILVIGKYSNTGCLDSGNIITMNIKPIPAIQFSASDSGVCTGTLIQFNAQNADNYSFLVNGLSVQSGTLDSWSSSVLNNGDKVSVAGSLLSDG